MLYIVDIFVYVSNYYNWEYMQPYDVFTLQKFKNCLGEWKDYEWEMNLVESTSWQC